MEAVMTFQMLQALLWAAALAALLASAWTDLRDRIIPDELVGAVAASGLCLGLMLAPGQIWISLIVAVLVVIGLGMLAHFGMMGGGDVKLIGATTLLVPLDQIGQLMAFIAVAGGLLSCVYLFLRRFVRAGSLAKSPSHTEAIAAMDGESQGLFSNECARIAAGGPMPYAFAIVGGVAGTFAGEIPRCLSANFCFFWASLS
jgi:prepilin peptidase CpaA